MKISVTFCGRGIRLSTSKKRMLIETLKTMEKLLREIGIQLLKQGKKENSNSREAKNSEVCKFHGTQLGMPQQITRR